LTRTPTADARTLSQCLPDPRGWGAAQSEAATYSSRTDATARMNEFVLRFADASAAHRAVLAAWTRLRTCHWDGPLGPPAPYVAAGFPRTIDDILVGQSSGAHMTNPATGALADVYVVRIGRASNLVVVFEDTSFPSDRSHALLQEALDSASPQYRASHPANVCFVGGEDCLNPSP
jgi:hypothetical protein